MVSLDGYIPTIDAILEVSDLEKISVKRMRRALQELFSVDFSKDKKSINDLIMQRYSSLVEDRASNKKRKKSLKDLEKEDELTAARLHPPSKVKRKAPKKSRAANTSSGLMRPLKLSDALSEFLQADNLARPEIVKRVWNYIKEHDLQNAEDRREIICDEKLKPVFGSKMTMFSLNKILSDHIAGPGEVAEEGVAQEDVAEEDVPQEDIDQVNGVDSGNADSSEKSGLENAPKKEANDEEDLNGEKKDIKGDEPEADDSSIKAEENERKPKKKLKQRVSTSV